MLVDADAMTDEKIKSAMHVLSESKVFVFANPARVQKWEKCASFQSDDVTFQPVHPAGGVADPTDEAIKARAYLLAKKRHINCVALLTSDSGFVDIVHHLRSAGKEVVVLLPYSGSFLARSAYEAARARVIMLEPLREWSKVHAMLNSDGTGSVSLRHVAARSLSSMECAQIEDFLRSLRCDVDGDPSFVALIAKLWHQHALGPLGVYPGALAWQSLQEVLAKSADRQSWARYQSGWAFVLPLASNKLGAAHAEKFGGRRAKQIFHGGGPFILADSHSLPMTVMTKLGYLDDSFNSDFPEALTVFANNTYNKRCLRKQGLLPAAGDTHLELLQKIRRALLRGEGSWGIAPRDTSVREMLMARRLLDSKSDSQEQVLEAMKSYMKLNQLPRMKTYKGCLWQILYHLSACDPHRRDVVLTNRKSK